MKAAGEQENMEETINSVGPKLREARIAAKLSVGEVASELHFGEQIIHQLEDEEFEKFPAPAFIRGYLRTYAKLLGLPAAPLLKALEQHHLHAPELISDIAKPHQAKSTDAPMRMATYGIFGGLLLLLALWWHNEYGISLFDYGPKTPVPITNNAPIIAPTQPANVAAPPVAEVIPPPPPPSTPLAETGQPVPDSTVVPENAATTVAPVIDTPQPEPPAPVAEANPPSPQPAKLSLTFAHDSWVEVYGGDGNRIYLDLAREGETLNLEGIAPLDVLLGYAQGARIKYNGQDFDFKTFVHQGVARFQLGGPETADTDVVPATLDNEATQN